MKKEIYGIEVELLFDYDGNEYQAYTQDGGIIVVKEWYGSDADGRRGSLLYHIDEVMIEPDDVIVTDNDGNIVGNDTIRAIAQKKLEDKLYGSEFGDLL